MKVLKFRVLRQKYGISLEELGNAAGVSCQRINQIELNESPHTEQVKKMVEKAFANVVINKQRKLDLFTDDFRTHQNSLFETVEENYEL